MGSKTLKLILTVSKVCSLVVLVCGMIAISVLQDKIAQSTPDEASSSATELGSWMTFFSQSFLFLAITEVYDEIQMKLLTPRKYAKRRQRLSI